MTRGRVMYSNMNRQLFLQLTLTQISDGHTLCIYFVIIISIITFVYISESINVFIYLVTYRPIWPGAFCVFVHVIVYNYVNVCTCHNNKPFTYLLPLKRISNWPPSFCYILVNVFGEKYK